MSISGISLPTPKVRNLFFSEQVTQETILTLSKEILEINENDSLLEKLYAIHDLNYKAKPIKILIDSYGGSVYQCRGLLSIMDCSITPIHTIVTGCAMSCGFMILINGHKRFAYEQSTALYHQVSSGACGTLKDLQDNVEECKRLQKDIETLTLKKTKISKEKLEKIFKEKKDWYIESNQCLKLGIVDEIIKPN